MYLNLRKILDTIAFLFKKESFFAKKLLAFYPTQFPQNWELVRPAHKKIKKTNTAKEGGEEKLTATGRFNGA